MTADYTLEKTELHDRDLSIPAYIAVPKTGSGPFPTVIYSHGLGGSRRSALKYVKTLVSLGYALISFDFPGGGSNDSLDSDKMSVLTEMENLESIMKQVSEFDFVDEKRIILMGASQGGLVSAMTGAKHENAVQGLILLYPAFVIPDFVREMYSYREDVPETYDVMDVKLGSIYALDMWDLDVYELSCSFSKPVLIIQGDIDVLVPKEYSDKAAGLYENCTYRVIENGEHGFRGKKLEEANSYIKQFINNSF